MCGQELVFTDTAKACIEKVSKAADLIKEQLGRADERWNVFVSTKDKLLKNKDPREFSIASSSGFFGLKLLFVVRVDYIAETLHFVSVRKKYMFNPEELSGLDGWKITMPEVKKKRKS